MCYYNKTGFVQMNLELRTLYLATSTSISEFASTFNVLTLVLVYEYFEVLMDLSLAIQMARLWRGEPI